MNDDCEVDGNHKDDISGAVVVVIVVIVFNALLAATFANVALETNIKHGTVMGCVMTSTSIYQRDRTTMSTEVPAKSIHSIPLTPHLSHGYVTWSTLTCRSTVPMNQLTSSFEIVNQLVALTDS